MDPARFVRASKFLSKYLRHQPGALGLTLERGGWVEIEQLLAACAAHRFPISRDELEEVVARNDKQRFSFDSTGRRIRANQGHSVEVDLELQPVRPPALLYHGTGHRSAESIRKDGLQRMDRHHVHLSGDVETARRVGSRHGRPVVFEIAATAMADDGFTFYRSANGVWLVDCVPGKYLKPL